MDLPLILDVSYPAGLVEMTYNQTVRNRNWKFQVSGLPNLKHTWPRPRPEPLYKGQNHDHDHDQDHNQDHDCEQDQEQDPDWEQDQAQEQEQD